MKKVALISVFDKEGIVDFAKKLVDLGWDIISTGGSYKLLVDHDIDAREVSDVTEFPEIFGGRVKTLNPMIHGGILYRRDHEEDQEIIDKFKMPRIDMVVNNLYPFEKLLDEDRSEEDMIENIDIGGPAMIRAAAKNFKDVLIVTDKNDYEELLERLEKDKIDMDYRRFLSIKAFNTTAYYDSLIYRYFNRGEYDLDKLVLGYSKDKKLRYGENPHQKAYFYEDKILKENQKLEMKQLHGKEISYNNINDLYGAVRCLREFDRPTAVGVKHTNPSGIGSGETIDEAFDKAYNCDKISIFGGIIALNRTLTVHIAEIINSMFMEIVIAPSYEPQALEILKQKKNIRLLESSNINDFEFKEEKIKDSLNGLLLQNEDDLLYEKLEVVTDIKPSDEDLKDLIFAYKAVKNVNSNAVVIAKDEATLGYGFGEVRRSWAVEKAIDHSEFDLEGSVLASDGFFFEDTVELLKDHKIRAAISPGGSIHDKKVIELCNAYGIALVFTNTRHFKH